MSKRITNIVFSRNRPMQLHGYLQSLYRFMPVEQIRTLVLYKPELFDAEYESCFAAFADCGVIRETDFHRDLLTAVQNADTEYMLFGIDDVVYFDGVDMGLVDQAFETLGPDLLGFTLRLDRRQMPEEVRAGSVTQRTVNGQAVDTLDWTRAQTDNGQYPFELCATVYRTRDVQRLFSETMKGGALLHALFAPDASLTQIVSAVYPRRKFLKKLGYFFSPNTLESWCCRYVQHHPDRFGRLLAFQKICASAIQVNCVNTTTANTWDEDENLTVERLNEKYQQGWRLDIDAIAHDRPLTPHVDRHWFKMVRVD